MAEEHFLKDYVEGKPGFKPEAWYNPYGDCVVYQTVNEAIYADRLDSLTTLYRSAIDDRVIGFQIKGVKEILRALKCDIPVEGTGSESEESISLIALVIAACKLSHDREANKDQLEALAELIPHMAHEKVPIPRAA